MSEEVNNSSEIELSPEEITRAKDLQTQLRRGISELLADPLTPECFKKAFEEGNN